MKRAGGALGLLALALGWSTCGPPPEALPPALYLTPRPREIDDRGAVSQVQAYVADAKGTPRRGSVTMTAAAGTFVGGGRTAAADLDQEGRAAFDWTCAVAADPGCTGNVRLEARWESGSEFLVQVVRISVGPPDGGTSDGGGTGPADAGPASVFVSAGKVFLWGTLSEGACYRDAFAEVEAPTAAAVGFTCSTSSPRIIGDQLVYLDTGTDTLKRFVADRFEWSTSSQSWSYPSNPAANDVAVPTPGCSGVREYWPAPDGKLLYRCAATGQLYLDGTLLALPVGVSPIAMGAGGLMLVRDTSWLGVRAPDGGVTLVTKPDGGGFPVGLNAVARSAPQGRFYFASGETPARQYLVSPDGGAALQGTYAALPAGYQVYGTQVLDGVGDLWVPSYSGGNDAIVKLPLEPAGAQLVYSEANAVPNDYRVTPPRLFVKMHISKLVTGP